MLHDCTVPKLSFFSLEFLVPASTGQGSDVPRYASKTGGKGWHCAMLARLGRGKGGGVPRYASKLGEGGHLTVLERLGRERGGSVPSYAIKMGKGQQCA